MMRFKAEYTVDEIDYLSFVRINRYVRGRVPRKLLMGAVAAVGALLVLLCILLTVRGAWTMKNAMIVAIGALIIIWELRRDSFNANENRRKMERYVDKLLLTADDGGIEVISGGNAEHVDFKSIEEIYHTRGSLFVYVADDRAYIIPDSAFISGSAEDFAAFAAKKCGKSVNNIKL